MLVDEPGFRCFVNQVYHEDYQYGGYHESFLVYCCHFTYQYIEGPLEKSFRSYASKKSYEFAWAHEVTIFNYFILSLIFLNFSQESLFASADLCRNRSGMLSVGDWPFTVILPEPILSTPDRRFYHRHSFEHYNPTA